jgi:hypothetical protein
MPVWWMVSLTDSGLVFYERRKKMEEEKKVRFRSGRIVAAEQMEKGQHSRNFSLSL